MWTITIIVGAFIASLIAFSFGFGNPIYAVPLVFIGMTVFGAFDFRRRRKQAKQMEDYRREAQAEKIDFTERDKETLVSE